MSLRIAGGTVLTDEGWIEADLFVDGTSISTFGGGSEPSQIIDASGCLVGPGFVDLHTHLREPGQTWKEDIASGSAAAVAGGYTAVVAMPNTDPPIDAVKVVETVLAAGREADLLDLFASGALTRGRIGVEPADLAALYGSGVRLFTDDGDSVTDTDVLRSVMTSLAALEGAVLAQHAEDHSRTGSGHMHEGDVSRRLGVAGLPGAAESDIVARDLGLVAETGVRYHCQHVSTAQTVDLIRHAKQKGLPVTAEVTPHHLWFDESDLLELDTDLKMYPPLRSSADRTALVEGLRDGTIDVVATDHAPHTPEEKSVPFDDAPRGVIGLETAAGAVWPMLADPDRFFEVMSRTPARLIGTEDHGHPLGPGRPANLVVFDTEQRWTPESFRSRSSNSPFRGRELVGKVRATIWNGRPVYTEGGAR